MGGVRPGGLCHGRRLRQPGAAVAAAGEGMTTHRERLPQRRASITFAFWHDGFDYAATAGFYPDGRIGEVFLAAAKDGTALSIATRDSAIALSFALQHGCRLATIREAMTRAEDGQPQGALGALVDLLCQHEAEMMGAAMPPAGPDTSKGD